jgi:iron-sulfur cluster insertion protein
MQLTEIAQTKIKDIFAEENNPALKLRVFVQGGGCSGFQYGFTFDEEKTDDDFSQDYDGVEVLIDSMSWQYLHGATVDYKEDAMGSSFVIDNPNAQSTCGCGSSFSPY